MNFKNWSKPRFNLFTVFAFVMYYIISVIVPLVYLILRFDLFVKAENVGMWTGIAIFLIILGGIEFIKRSKGLLEKLPQATHQQAMFKFSSQMVFSLLIPIVGIIILFLLKINWEFYRETLMILFCTQIVCIILDTYIMKFIYNEIRIRKNSSEMNELQDRQDLMR